MISSLKFLSSILRIACLSVLLALSAMPCLEVRAANPESKADRTLRVVMDNNYPPYVFVNNDGQIQGILADQWRLWQKKTGIRVELIATDWKDALRDMKAGKYDVIDTAFETEERKTWLEFGKPHARIEVAAYFDKAISAITSVDSLQGFVVAVKCLSINNHDLVQDNHSSRQCVECNIREIRLLVSRYQFAKPVEP